MKAIVCPTYGSPELLELREVEKPIPKDKEVLIRVHAATVNRTDAAILRARPFFMRVFTGLFKPKRRITGTEFAGEIEAVGKKVTSYRVGDKVFGFDDTGLGSHAQYTTISEDRGVTTIPNSITYEQAAPSTEGPHYAYSCIKKVNIRSGQKALVYGATGAIGSAAVQILRHFDAKVTAVCSTRNVELVKSLGADRVVDYTKEDFTKDEERYHFVFDAVGKTSFFKCRPLLQSGGVYVSTDLGYMAQNLVLPSVTPIMKPMMGNKKTISPFPIDIRESLLLIRKLLEQGELKAIIDRRYTLDQIVEAYKYVEGGHKTGTVVITVGHEG